MLEAMSFFREYLISGLFMLVLVSRGELGVVGLCEATI